MPASRTTRISQLDRPRLGSCFGHQGKGCDLGRAWRVPPRPDALREPRVHRLEKPREHRARVDDLGIAVTPPAFDRLPFGEEGTNRVSRQRPFFLPALAYRDALSATTARKYAVDPLAGERLSLTTPVTTGISNGVTS